MQRTTLTNMIALLFLPASPLYAEEAEPLTLDSIVVIGKQETLNNDKSLAGSVDIITRDELEYEHVTDSLELFTKTPGVVLSRYNQGIINTDLSIRGFTGDGETPHAKLLVDGIPSNLYNGYNEMDYLFPTNIQNIQVFKGTSDASTGLFATAGSYRVETRKDAGKQLQTTLGSFNTREIQGYYGDKLDGFTHNYAIGYRAGNGYRDHTDIEKIALSGRWQYDFEQSSLALSTKYGQYHAFEAPGYLNKQQARANPTSSAPNAANDGGDKTFKHISLHYDHFLNDDVDISLKTYWQEFERNRSVRFVTSPNTEFRTDDQTSTGLIAKLSWRLHPQWMLETGYDIELQQIEENRQRKNAGGVNITRRNYDFSFDAQGAYVKVENTPADWLRWNFALRADQLDAHDQQPFIAGTNANPTLVIPTTLRDSGTILQPKLNVFASVTDKQTVFFNAGRSFQTPIGGDLNTRNGTINVDVAINDGWETGLKSTWLNTLNTRVSYWQQTAKDEFVPVDGTRQLIGETKRQGIDVSFDNTFNEMWSFWGNLSLINQKVVKGPDNNRSLDGNKIRGIPDHTASLGLQFKPSSVWVARVHVDRQGAYYVNENNLGGEYGAYTLIHANVDYKTSWGSVSLQANNIFDKYYEYVYDFSSNGSDLNFSPGAGRNFSLTATVDF